MTVAITGEEVVGALDKELKGAVKSVESEGILVQAEKILDIALCVKNNKNLKLDYLVSITGTDYIDYLEVSYLFYSLDNNKRFTLKVRLENKSNPAMPSLTGIWIGAELQEREIYDLLGITFSGHPNMKRIFLWEGFHGHPLRKDFSNGN